MSEQKAPSQLWEELKEEILSKIEEIDCQTPWQDVEPNWWMDMKKIEREILKLNK